jgi:hypothetical protein
MRSQHEITEIRKPDLGFDINEIAQFFSDVMGFQVSRESIELMEQRTEGWNERTVTNSYAHSRVMLSLTCLRVICHHEVTPNCCWVQAWLGAGSSNGRLRFTRRQLSSVGQPVT